MSDRDFDEVEERFEAKVATIIDKYRVVINRGANDGVRVGQRYLILNIGDEIFDPDTGESLGQIEVVKGKGEVTHVQDRLATLQTIESHEIRRRPSGLLALAQFSDVEVTSEPKAFIDPEVGDIARLL
ncbi:hypothetical protein GCM10007160_24270 [Litchfieldella qijiaojingensis]|uniref:Uncharacterized protein n=1 Tax=Litchfieldella qijiaojingensis TaxID=980347 RepID=A0ABQ2YWP4_9GAMM|nr:hypothetical protein [Halomonas qijiaojingensis]GGX95794.1 hypothetical protein GCM10007160_24270 [Halomonas qijiaojingensis]